MEDFLLTSGLGGMAAELTPLNSHTMESFGDLLSSLIEERRTQAAKNPNDASLAIWRDMSYRQLGPMVKLSHTQVRDIVANEATPSLDFIERMANLLKLSGETRRRFVLLGRDAWAAGSNKEKLDHVVELRAKNETLLQQLVVVVMTLENVILLCEQKGLKIPRDLQKTVAEVKSKIRFLQ